jgi:rhodanese-related sulfurtransferase
MNNHTTIEVSELSSTLANKNVLLVDVRNDDEVARGIIAGAIHIQLATLPLAYEKLAKAESVVFYCHSGIRSAHAADFAASKGIKSVNLIGGVVAWVKAGNTLSPKL